MDLRAKHGQPRREARHNSLKVECKETAAHLVECPSLRELRRKRGLETPKDGELFFSAQLASFLKELFKLESPSAPTSEEPELRPAHAVKRHRSSTELNTTYSPSAPAKRIGVRTARGMRKRVREADPLTKAICFNVLLGEARMGSGFRSTSHAGLQRQGSTIEPSGAPADCNRVKGTMANGRTILPSAGQRLEPQHRGANKRYNFLFFPFLKSLN
ncbi:hypothetical protein ERJ75_000391400 [Trypanosoma vivax]|nr:hypothetical protein ERJ75_000391400 [Trypanosoma vivax]